jgi:hypothetical protein
MTQVIFTSNCIGSTNRVVAEFENHEEAKALAKKYRTTLSLYEKHYYKMSYIVKKIEK